MKRGDLSKKEALAAEETSLFSRVVSILEQARANVVRAVNSSMVTAYWLIGREIVLELQGGEERAEYGKQVIENLSGRLTNRYGKGFSAPTLWSFRQFYQAYSFREPQILSPSGREFEAQSILFPPGRESAVTSKRTLPTADETRLCFNPHLSWSHYRALMRVSTPEARQFYEQEAAECGWSKAQLERQIQTSYYERILKNRGQDGLLPATRERLPGEALPPIQLLKSPYVLEFLDLPDSPSLHEKDLEQAIICNLQSFLLELGKGFSFVARQKHIRFDEDDFYIDLVFYNYLLKYSGPQKLDSVLR